MSRPVENKLKSLCSRAFERELEKCGAEEGHRSACVELDAGGICDLSERIGALVPTDQSILYFHYCFKFSDKRAGEILGEAQPFAVRIYLQNVLSVFLCCSRNLTEGSRIGEKSMALACEKALLNYTAYNPAEFSGYPVYSRKIRRKLKKIRAAQRTGRTLEVFVRRVAIVVLVFTMGFTTAMVTNAEFRGRVTEWFVETFPDFTRFQIGNASDELGKELIYRIEYLPDGFQLINSIEEENICHYRYEKGIDMISITYATFPISNAINTEDIIAEPFEFRGNQAYRWEILNMKYMVWSQDEFHFSIFSTLEQEEIYNISNGIKIN